MKITLELTLDPWYRNEIYTWVNYKRSSNEFEVYKSRADHVTTNTVLQLIKRAHSKSGGHLTTYDMLEIDDAKYLIYSNATGRLRKEMLIVI